MLKALILSVLPADSRVAMLASFRGRRAHDFEWLKAQYVETWRAGIPSKLSPHLTRVNTWSSDMRYETGTIKRREADAFLNSSAEIIRWADGGL
jgi:hypothetical protein